MFSILQIANGIPRSYKGALLSGLLMLLFHFNPILQGLLASVIYTSVCIALFLLLSQFRPNDILHLCRLMLERKK